MFRFTLRCTTTAPEYIGIDHWHFGVELIYAFAGNAVFEIEGQEVALSAGQIILINRMQKHQTLSFSEDYKRCYMILRSEEIRRSTFSSKRIEKLFDAAKQPYIIVNPGDDRDNIIRILEYFESHWLPSEDETVHDICRCLYELLLILVSRHCKTALLPCPADERILAIRDEIDRTFTEPITVSSLAKQNFVSEDYLIHQFRRVTGYSPGQYILMNRLTYAQELLTATNDTIPSVAAKSGFGNVNNFIRTFKKQYGVPPGQYRRRRTDREKFT